MTTQVRKEIRLAVEHLHEHKEGKCFCPEIIGGIQAIFNTVAKDARDEHEGAIPLTDWVSIIENASLDGCLFTFYADPFGKIKEPHLHFSRSRPFSLRLQEANETGGVIRVESQDLVVHVNFEYDPQNYANPNYKPSLFLSL